MAAMRKKLDMDDVLTQHNITGKTYRECDRGDFEISVCTLAAQRKAARISGIVQVEKINDTLFKFQSRFFSFTIAKPVIISIQKIRPALKV